MLTLALLLSLLSIAPTSAWRLKFQVHSWLSQLVVNSSDPFTFQNVYNSTAVGKDIYVANLTVGERPYEVQLDTGSSDLWLDTTGVDTSSFTNTGQSGKLQYGDGTIAEGPILIGNLTFGDFVVQQAFISAPGTNATTSNDTGLLGLGPGSLSQIEATLTGTSFDGDTVLENVFSSNDTLGRFVTMELSRSFDTGHSSGGVFSVGEIIPEFSNVTESPKLGVVSDDRWIVLMDGIVVDGNNVSGHSSIQSSVAQPNQTLANLDSGTGLGQIPQFYLDAIYSKVPGASFIQNKAYVVPCDTNIALSFVFGGIAYPVHPIDTVVAVTDNSGDIACISGFTVIDSSDTIQDFLLGDTFLRNVYASYNFGSFVANDTTPPFIQLLSTTDAQQASSEFTSLSQKRNASIKAATGGGGSGGGGSGGGGSGTNAAVSIYVGYLPAVILYIAAALLGISCVL